MSLNIKSREAHELAAELARLTGESMTKAVTEALRERLERKRREHDRESAGRLQRAHVVVAQGEHLVVGLRDAGGHADERAPHMRSGTGMPSRAVRRSIWRTKASTTATRNARRSSLSAWRTE